MSVPNSRLADAQRVGRISRLPIVYLSVIVTLLVSVAGGPVRKVIDRTIPLGQPHDPGYVERLRIGQESLNEYVEWAGWSLTALADEHPRVYTEVLCDFVAYEFERGTARGEVESAVLSFKERFDWTRLMLHPVWARIREWKLREPVEMRAPASEELTRSLMSCALSWGWWRTALIIYLAFHCMLRPSDHLPLIWEDIRLLAGNFKVAVLVIKGPKTRKTGARRQHVLIEDVFLLRLLRDLLMRMPPAERIMPLTYAAFSNRLRKLLAAVGVPGAITPSSFRAGGATWHWLKRRNFHELRLRGRWLVARTLEVYIQECTAFLGEKALSSQQARRLYLLSRECLNMWRSWRLSW